jgi:hypothetical protein
MKDIDIELNLKNKKIFFKYNVETNKLRYHGKQKKRVSSI